MTQHTEQPRSGNVRPNPAPEDLLDVDQAAIRLGTPVRFVRRLIAERRIRFYKIGRYVRIDPRDLDTFIGDGCIEPAVRSSSWAASTDRRR